MRLGVTNRAEPARPQRPLGNLRWSAVAPEPDHLDRHPGAATYLAIGVVVRFELKDGTRLFTGATAAHGIEHTFDAGRKDY